VTRTTAKVFTTLWDSRSTQQAKYAQIAPEATLDLAMYNSSNLNFSRIFTSAKMYQGDIGGPLFVDGIVVGLVSWSNGCATPGYPTVHTRVAHYRDWINQLTGV
jgi:secreted trypsin-like serine protease